MNKFIFIILCSLLTFGLGACSQKNDQDAKTVKDSSLLDQQAKKSMPAQPDQQAAAPASEQPEMSPSFTETVLETMNAGQYTYVRVEKDGKSLWVAGPVFSVKVGDEVAVYNEMIMNNFYSKTLDRTFEEIFFSPTIYVVGPSDL